MALWMHDITHKQWDDGLKAKPGEEGFTRELAEQHFGDKDFSYCGTPNWEAPAPPAPPAGEGDAPVG